MIGICKSLCLVLLNKDQGLLNWAVENKDKMSGKRQTSGTIEKVQMQKPRDWRGFFSKVVKNQQLTYLWRGCESIARLSFPANREIYRVFQ